MPISAPKKHYEELPDPIQNQLQITFSLRFGQMPTLCFEDTDGVREYSLPLSLRLRPNPKKRPFGVFLCLCGSVWSCWEVYRKRVGTKTHATAERGPLAK